MFECSFANLVVVSSSPVAVKDISLKLYWGSHLSKKLFLETSQYSQENTCVRVSFNSEYCEIFKSTFFEENLSTTASKNVFLRLRKIKYCSQRT